MNWIIKLKKLGENIKKNVLKKFPSREQLESSKWKALNTPRKIERDPLNIPAGV